MNREELIEEAAKAIWIAKNEITDREWADSAWAELTMPDDWNHEALDALDEARAALAVFEQAHTPTDDEREALANLIRRDFYRVDGLPDDEDRAIADVVLEAGFRRTVQATTPTEDERAEWTATLEALLAEVYTILKPLAEGGTHSTSSPILKAYALLNAQEFTRRTMQGEPTEREARVNYCPEHGDLLDGDRRSARCQETHSIHEIRAGFRRAVQGEPTDAQVLAEVREHAQRWADRPPTSPYGMGLRDAWRTILRKIDGRSAADTQEGEQA